MPYLKRFIQLIFGFFVIAIGVVLHYKASLGMSPWGTLDLGMNNVFGITIGASSQLIGLIIIFFSWFLGIKPSFGTIANMFSIGFFVDVINAATPGLTLNTLPLRLIGFAIGLLFFNFGIYLYLHARLGGGPRDSLMLGLIKRLHLNVAPVRIAMEATAITVGFLMGAKVGFGTVVLTLFNGPILQYMFKLFKFDPKKQEQESFAEVIRGIRGIKTPESDKSKASA